MEEPCIASQDPHLEDLSDNIKSCRKDCSCESNKASNNVSLPICFLVREQAKSIVAIQELQNRLNHVETVQVDVIDTLMHFRNYLCDGNDSDVATSSNYLNATETPITISPTSKTSAETYHSSSVPSQSIINISTYPTKEKKNDCNEFQRTSPIVTIQDQPHKHFESTKSKDFALESDKQDSGLDSDCREHNDGQSSVRVFPNWVNHDTNDQLLHLLDEISYRSECLQKQLTITETNIDFSDTSERMYAEPKQQNEISPSKSKSCHEVTLNVSQDSVNKTEFAKSSPTNISHEAGVQVTVPAMTKYNNSENMGFFERKSFCNKSSYNNKRIGKTIDSTLVSSILKESNVVELQRQALIYLVDNAVLNTKFRDLEQTLAYKNIESDKVENSLKEEARLLMLENRELRICLDEQKIEANILKSRVSMLEKILQSMNIENQELNWQLGESLNLQNISKKTPGNFSSSLNAGNLSSSTRLFRKSSSLPSQSGRSSAISCAKSKLLSNASNYLDVTAEEPVDCVPDHIQVIKSKCRNGPIQSSTPFQRPKSNVVGSHRLGLPVSFHSAKKCLKSGHSFDSDGISFKSAKSGRCSGEYDIPEACVRNCQFPCNSSQEALTSPLENVSAFPFNTILEKLKANSELRLSKNVPTAKIGEASSSASNHEVELSSNNEQFKSPSNSPQVNGKNNVQTRKNRNIHQRIQNILDRIVAESEETS